LGVREEMHYKLQLENYDKGAKIISKGDECHSIYFLVSGTIDLVIEREAKEHVLDTITSPGSTIGAYSVFNESHFVFNVKARTNVAMLSLHRDDFIFIADQFEEIAKAIEKTSDFLIHHEIP
jgi:CRP-like cAMP-binding protein